jgi:phospholipase/lecithinase/hemolysin
MRPARTILLLAVLAAAALGTAPAPALAAPQLVVFGDSYSLTVRDGVRDWPALLRQRGLVGRIANFARSGGTAITRRGPDFAKEIAAWARAGRPRGVTVVFFGYTDIGGDMAGARAGYRAGVDALVRAGAASGGNRLLLVEPHDVGSLPLYNRTSLRGFLRRETEDWDGFVAYTAHHVGAMPVDVFAAIDRVLKNPGRYGFTNVTTADRARSGTTALYREPFHVGQRGQAIIADTIAARLR